MQVHANGLPQSPMNDEFQGNAALEFWEFEIHKFFLGSSLIMKNFRKGNPVRPRCSTIKMPVNRFAMER